jgi:hypothetical protein
MASPFAYTMYDVHHALATENRSRGNLLPTHFDFRKTKVATSFGKSDIPAEIRRETVEDG